jgi:hypothetical protein
MYSNPDKLAQLLGIEKLPDFSKEPFDAPFEEIFTDRKPPETFLGRMRARLSSKLEMQDLLAKVNKYRKSPATAEELQTVLELFKLGMHYVQVKTGENVNRKIYFTDDGSNECAFNPMHDTYLLTPQRLANFVHAVRSPDRQHHMQHKPTMGYNAVAGIVLAGAEEAHHAVTYKKNRRFYDRHSNNDDYPIPYFKDGLELEFGKFLPQIVSDFGFDVKQIPILSNIRTLKGELSEEEYKQLYRKRLEQRYSFKLPTDEEIKDAQREK